jgi:EAL domain-containing protein (putative c-di-GMP-specific phosphodiesterase class I)
VQGALRLRRGLFEPRRRARTFVAIFTAVVLGSLAGLGVIVAHLAGESVEAAGAEGTEASAATLVRVTLRPGDVRGGQLRAPAFERLTRAALVSGVIDEVRVWRRGAGIVRDAHGATAAAVRRSAALEEAFDGTIASEVAHDAAAAAHAGQGRCHERREMHVFVPLHRRGGPIQEVLELCAPHAAIAQAASDRRRGLLVVVLVGALLLWLVVLPAVLTSARLLAERAERRNRPLVRALRHAMRHDELTLHYQPKLCLQTGEVEGVEALLRWRHPRHGDVPPLSYLPAAERTDVIGELTLHTLALATRQAAEWRRRGLEVSIAVNVAPAALEDARLAADLAALLGEQDVPAWTITLEITEGALSGSGMLAGQVEALAGVGVCVSIDDFGTGESSLARLDRLPLHELKIDRAFISAVAAGGQRTLLAAIIRTAHELGLRTVAEGVETEEMVECLRTLGCDAIQGFHISRPLPADEIETWLRERADRGARRAERRLEPARTSVRSGGPA